MSNRKYNLLTVKEIADLSGVSSKTIRYYDSIALLSPEYTTDAGYRVYTDKQVDKLQEILFYKALDLDLATIKIILGKKNNRLKILEEQKEALVEKKNYYEKLIKSIENTIKNEKGEYKMSNAEKFEVLKEKLLVENEEKYGEEIRGKYGEDTIKKSNKAWKDMTENEYNKMMDLENKFKDELKKSLLENTLDELKKSLLENTLDEKVYTLHKDWLMASWKGAVEYSKEAHASIVDMYLCDERFHKWFDGDVKSIEHLKKIVEKYVK